VRRSGGRSRCRARRDPARTQGWRGEIEGIDLTLRFLAGKRAETLRLARFSHDTVTSIGPAALANSLQKFTGGTAYTTGTLRTDLARFAFLLTGEYAVRLFGGDQQ
jgi:hypothetical protein